MSARLSRTDRSAVGRWFWTIDHVLLLLVIVLIGVGLIAVAAASPAAAYRYSGGAVQVGELHYFYRQLFWVALGLPLLVATSMLPVAWVRRLALVGTAAGVVALAAVPFAGVEINGALRWLVLGPIQVQPSEFLKPLFIVATATLLAMRFDDDRMPALTLSAVSLVAIVALLVMQPDMGQTALFVGVWLVMAFLAGMAPAVVGGCVAAAIAGIGTAYALIPHVTSRIDRFVTGDGDNYQVKSALACFRNGGLFGVGPGEGTAKLRLPEAQTDYIFAVIGEEFGAIACIAVACLFLAIVIRAVSRVMDEEDPFIFLGVAGLATQFGLQAAINMAVNLDLLPSKGMTLPFISHGGSSFLALSMGMGLLLALGRRNPFEKASPYAAQWRAA